MTYVIFIMNKMDKIADINLFTEFTHDANVVETK